MGLETETTAERFRRKLVPLSIYWLKDLIGQLVGNKNFHDAVVTSFALASIAIAFPFLPIPVLIPLILLVFILTFIHPLLGLMSLLFSALPMLIYQAPLLAWLFTLFISVSLIAGYKHYRIITYSSALIFLSLSYLGYALLIPGFIISILVLGCKRSVILAAVVILMAAMLSGLSGVAVSGPIVYNAIPVRSVIEHLSYANYLTPSKPITTFSNILSSSSKAAGTFVSLDTTTYLYDMFHFAILSVVSQSPFTLLQILLWLIVSFTVSNYAVRSRSPYKGSLASFFGFILPISYAVFSRIEGVGFNTIVLISFLATPIFIFSLEATNIDVVLALDVMKKDILGKFGVAFEDLTQGSTETLADIADYDETKKELKQAVLSPIEHREIAGAYGVKPTKGLLLFGPPGTGKTLLMRALANEIRAGFFYVKGSSLISPFPGESSQTLARIFATAKKHAPCVLFFDEIDYIAGRREMQESDIARELTTAMLSELDGFQKTYGVVVVGATNAPQLLDPSIMRPGRFDKIIYMPLPDQSGRAEIFKYYLSRSPIDKNIDYDKLASLTNRFSGADIKVICEEVGRQVGEKAVSKREMLIIRMQDILRILKVTTPSTSLAQLEEYNTFKLDYERRAHPEMQTEKEEKVMITDVVDLEEAKKALHEAVEIPIMHPDLVQKYDIGNIRGILLFGPPGTGKTLLMTAVANELGGVRVLTISGYDISRYGSERAVTSIKEIFDRAKEHSPAIVFIDEIDALVPVRDTANEAGIRLTGAFLQEFDKIKDTTGIVVVAATNRPDVLDPALLRAGRFDRLIFTPPPEKEDRIRLFESNLEKAPVSGDTDLSKLAEMTEGFTGADIANICRQAKLNALEVSLSKGSEVKVEQSELIKLIQKTRPSAPSIIMGRYLAFFSRYGKR